MVHAWIIIFTCASSIMGATDCDKVKPEHFNTHDECLVYAGSMTGAKNVFCIEGFVRDEK